MVSSQARFSSRVRGSGFSVKNCLPNAVGQHVHIIVGNVYVDGVVPVGPADILSKRQIQHFWVLPQIPDVRLVACQSGAVNTGLLSGADADGLSVLGIADRVGLGVFQGDQGNDQVAFGAFR